MIEKSTLSAIRFGYGLRPGETAHADTGAMLDGVRAASKVRPGADLKARAGILKSYRDARQAMRDGGRENKEPEEALRRLAGQDMRRFIMNAVEGHGFGERLVAFWADHFTVAATSPQMRVLAPDFLQAAIRPHIAGRFSDMLRAAMTHPAMLIYLNQNTSVGPTSVAGLRRDRGLNENLAREALELHTLGVDGDYTQADVRNLALVLTGLSVDQQGFKFRPGIAEPGRHRVLGESYGGQPKSLEDIRDALNGIASHTDTARHIATKLVVHFVGAPGDADLVRTVESAFRNSGGNLLATYRALLSHDAAWSPDLAKAKTPFEFIISAFRASDYGRAVIEALSLRDIRNGVARPMEEMGQAPLRPAGPDGWDEDPAFWITPPTLAARIRWAAALAERIAPDHDPRIFLETTLADAASEKLTFAVAGAESRVEGIALTLVSPEFNRR